MWPSGGGAIKSLLPSRLESSLMSQARAKGLGQLPVDWPNWKSIECEGNSKRERLQLCKKKGERGSTYYIVYTVREDIHTTKLKREKRISPFKIWNTLRKSGIFKSLNISSYISKQLNKQNEWNESFVRSPFLTLITTRIGNKTDKTEEEANEFSIQFWDKMMRHNL